MALEPTEAVALEPGAYAPPLSEAIGMPEAPSPSASTAAPEPAPAVAPEPAPAADPAAAPAPDPLAALQADLAAERAAREALQRELGARAVPPPAPEPAAAPRTPEPAAPRPRRDQFDTPDAYDAAVDQWVMAETGRVARETVLQAQETAAQAAQARRTQEATEGEQRRQREHMEALATSWGRQRAEAVARYPDFATVAERPDIQITPAMAAAIMQTANGADVAYHLGKTPTEAARIAALPPIQQAFELGRLAATIGAPKAPAVSRAADPIRPVGAVSPAAPSALSDLDMDAYAARRQAELTAATRRPGARAH